MITTPTNRQLAIEIKQLWKALLTHEEELGEVLKYHPSIEHNSISVPLEVIQDD